MLLSFFISHSLYLPPPLSLSVLWISLCFTYSSSADKLMKYRFWRNSPQKNYIERFQILITENPVISFNQHLWLFTFFINYFFFACSKLNQLLCSGGEMLFIFFSFGFWRELNYSEMCIIHIDKNLCMPCTHICFLLAYNRTFYISV